MIIFLLIIAILNSILAFFYARYLYGRVLSRFSFIDACPGLFDEDWWSDEK